MDLEDFVLSNNLLPLGSMVYLMFCTFKKGWGWKNFSAEANTGVGLGISNKLRFYMSYILPIIVFVIFIWGYCEMFFMK